MNKATVTALGVLDAAAAHQRERSQAYDQPGGERSAAAVATAFNAITRRTGERALSEPEAWLFLQILKQVRLFSAPGYHSDSAEDNVAYASLLAEAKAAEALRHPAGRPVVGPLVLNFNLCDDCPNPRSCMKHHTCTTPASAAGTDRV